MDNPRDAQVEAFIEYLERADVYHRDADNGEFIIDGVVNVRAALDAANRAVCDHVFVSVPVDNSHPMGAAKARCHYCGFEPSAERFTHHEPGEFGEGATVRVIGCDMRDGSAATSTGGDHG